MATVTAEYLLTSDALLSCAHQPGMLGIRAGQQLVFIEHSPLLVHGDPENRPITGCPYTGAGIKPCLTSLKVQRGYSDLISIEGKAVCLESVTGLTDGTPPGTVHYTVLAAGQGLVREVN